MAKDMNLSAQDIYEKAFHIDVKGYASSEVDDFLDLVIEDYQAYDEKLEELGQALTRYEEKIKQLQQEVFTLQTENQNLQEQMNSSFVSANTDMVDLLKRISRLEEAVFSKKED